MSLFSQFFPPTPTFTEKELPDQTGKVVLITGAASGLGFELAKILYSKNATVYISARSASRASVAITTIRDAHPTSTGRLEPFVADLSDLTTIKPAVESFLGKEPRLHVLVLNAGVMLVPQGSRTKQGHDMEMGTNCLGHFLFARLLEDILKRTASDEGVMKGNKRPVRTVWITSMIAFGTPKGGVVLDESGAPTEKLKGLDNYMQSKAGDVYLAAEFAKKWGNDGALSISVNPGLLKTELQRNKVAISAIMGVMFKPAKYGAYSELYAGFSDKIADGDNGGYIIPWGRRGVIPNHMQTSMSTKVEGGTGVSRRFFEWCELEAGKYI